MDLTKLISLVTNNGELHFKDFTSSDIGSFGLLENSSFTPYLNWGGEEQFKTSPSGFNNAKYASLSGTHNGTPIEFFIAEKKEEHTDKDGNRTVNYYYRLYMDVGLDFYVPHVRVTDSKKSIFSGKARNGVLVEFGEQFSDFFTVETVKGQEQKAFQILPPDTMIEIMKSSPNANIEYHMNSIRINFNFNISGATDSLTPSFLRIVSKQDFVDEFNNILNTLPELIDSAKTAAIKPEEFKKLGMPLSPAAGLFGLGFVAMIGSSFAASKGWIPFEVTFVLIGLFFVGVIVGGISQAISNAKRKSIMIKEGWTAPPKRRNNNLLGCLIFVIFAAVIAFFMLSHSN